MFNAGCNIDIDGIKIDKHVYIGSRLAYHRYSKSQIAGGTYLGSPFSDYDIHGRVALSGKWIDVNVCCGVTYHTLTNSLKWNNLYKNMEEKKVYTKFAGDIKFKIINSNFGLVYKFGISQESYAGLGIFLGYSSRDK